MTKPAICVCTPIIGSPHTADVSLAYHRCQLNFARDPSIPRVSFAACQSDLVRARSRMVRQFLESPTDLTHLLWWDADVVGEDRQVAQCITSMLASGHDVVAVPYPGKEIDWNGVARSVLSGGQPEWGAHQFGYHGGGRVGPDGCVSVDVCRGGFMLVSRRCLQAMVNRYEDELWFTDVIKGVPYRTVALYMLTFTALRIETHSERRLDAEDFSFCERWRAMGGKVYLYVGPGAPLNHIGPTIFTGHPEGIYDTSASDAAAQ